jgi:hypothetical protein
VSDYSPWKIVLPASYTAPPLLADAAINGSHPTWVTFAGVLIGLAGLALHAVQTWLKLRQDRDARAARIRPFEPRPFVPRLSRNGDGD